MTIPLESDSETVYSYDGYRRYWYQTDDVCEET